jgi:hypothetical protein
MAPTIGVQFMGGPARSSQNAKRDETGSETNTCSVLLAPPECEFFIADAGQGCGMAFRDFGFPDVQQAFGLTLAEADLFGGIPAMELPPTFVEWMRSGIDLALAINTEKARSEFIIAPMLLELKRLLGEGFGLFSGVEFNVDTARGLNGYCDFILTRSPLQSVLTAPIVAIAEAKNDNLRNGLGQCIAAMVAAREFNAQAPTVVPAIYGAVTTGAAWKFLRLAGSSLTLDVPEYFVAELGRILAILVHIMQTG